MKRLILGLAICLSSQASAQFIVNDPVSVAQNLLTHAETILYWKDQYDQMVDQIRQLERTHDSLTGIRDIGDVFENRHLRQFMSEDLQASYRAFRRSGYEGLVRKGIEIYRENETYDNCTDDVEDVKKLCQASSVHNSQVYGDSVEALDAISERSEEIDSLYEAIQQSEDMKTTAGLQARISLLQSEQEQFSQKLAVMDQLARAQQGLNRDQARQQAARTFAATKGLSPELPEISFD